MSEEERYKKLTILHSNDMHGAFLAENVDDKLVGGLPLLAGYVNKVREENPHTIYAIAGDMFRGSIIDSEYKGASTIDIMNTLAPDVIGIGNHELDYGVASLLFLEKCATFPIVNSNLYVTATGQRLFNSHLTVMIGDIKVLFIGVITESIMASAQKDPLLATFCYLEDAVREVGKICNNYSSMDIDYTVLITHIGYEEDLKFAEMLDPHWGVDLIIGGHSHTVIEKPAVVNNVVVVQAGSGTSHIGKLDVTIDTKLNKATDYSWEFVPITEDTCAKSEHVESVIENYKAVTDKKYGRVLARLPRAISHPRRNEETEVGNLFADAIATQLKVDVAFMGSGSFRKPGIGPKITLQDLMEILPFHDKLYAVELSGAMLKHAFKYILRDEFITGETEFYQVNKAVKIAYDFKTKEFVSFTINGEPVDDERSYVCAIQAWHLTNIVRNMDVPEEETKRFSEPSVISTSDFDVVEEYLTVHKKFKVDIEGRIEVLNRPR